MAVTLALLTKLLMLTSYCGFFLSDCCVYFYKQTYRRQVQQSKQLLYMNHRSTNRIHPSSEVVDDGWMLYCDWLICGSFKTNIDWFSQSEGSKNQHLSINIFHELLFYIIEKIIDRLA